MADSLNPWRAVAPLGPDAQPTLRATVVLPYHDALPELRRTLVALGAQDYPRALTEVVVVDDGSTDPLAVGDVADLLDVSVVNRPDEGFTLAAARNDGAALATGDVLVFLDCDMVPDPGWLTAHMRWHHGSDRALVLGFRDHVDVAGLSEGDVRGAMTEGGLADWVGDRTVERPEWIEFHMSRTLDLTSVDTDMFRVVTGGNLSVGADLFGRIGGFDSSFTRWGGEDTEFGYRAWNAGVLLVPERGAHCWHQGLGTTPDPGERRSQEIQRRKLAHLIPHPGFREDVPGRRWLRASVVAVVGPGEPAEVVATARALEATADLVVCVPDGSDPLVAEDLDPDPAIAVGGMADDFPHVPFVLEVPAGLRPTPDHVASLLADAGGTGRVETDQGIAAVFRRRVALGGTPARSDVYVEVVRPPSTAAKVASRMGRIRSWDDAKGAVRWFSAAVGRRLGRPGRVAPAPASLPASTDPWERVRIVAVPALGTGGQPTGRVDLVVASTVESLPADADGPTLVLAGRPDEADLTAPLLDGVTVATLLRMTTAGGDPRAEVARLVGGRPGRRVAAAMEAGWPEQEPDREARLESIRRAVLVDHGREWRRSHLYEAAGLPPTLPTVSVLLSTTRPERVGAVLSALGAQTYPHLEVVVVAHGVDVPSGIVDRLGEVEHRVVTVPAEVPFGAALQLGTRASVGELVAKVDDDDLYGPSHIEDLVLAHVVSGADLVGKGAEFVHLESEGRTIRRFVGGAWTRSTTIAGGALAVRRAILDEVGGWRPVPRHVDRALIDDIRAVGGSVFRTHPFGFVLVRHGSHTWESDDRSFLDQAEASWDGLPDALIG